MSVASLSLLTLRGEGPLGWAKDNSRSRSSAGTSETQPATRMGVKRHPVLTPGASRAPEAHASEARGAGRNEPWGKKTEPLTAVRAAARRPDESFSNVPWRSPSRFSSGSSSRWLRAVTDVKWVDT